MINVLISFYNGGRFIEQQIESILNQTYKDYRIYVRDDGSTDGSIKKVEKYLSTGKVLLYGGENLGFAHSFLDLLQKADTGEYWAFCDQDDVWDCKKLEWAMDWMEKQNCSVPCLFHSSYENVDIDLKHLSYYLPPKYEYNFQRSLTECLYFGFSMVINSSLREKMLLCDPVKIDSHDWLAQMIAVEFGKTIFDARIASKHRRHSESVTLDNGRKKIAWLYQSIKRNNKIANNAEEFERVFRDCLNENDRYILSLFVHKTLYGNIVRAFYPKRWRPSLVSEAVLRCLMLFGKS